MMLKKTTLIFLTGMILGTALAVPTGRRAPLFSGQGYNGKMVRLSDFRGKYVVLEWHNQGCPFVKKHYDSGNMQKLQAQWTKKGVAWLSIISSAPGKQGHVTPAEEKGYLARMKAVPTTVILDPNGTIGHLYGAKTSPHMFVIDPRGILIYNGAIDDRPSTDSSDIPGAKNYVDAALTEAMAGKPVSVSNTPPYGCSIKYKD